MLFEALTDVPPETLVDLLEFVACQHSGSSFNPDNFDKALEIAAFCSKRPFAVSKPGVACLAKLARHALGCSTGTGNTPEHQLWLLTSSALNTAAAINEHEGGAAGFFEACRKDGVVRGKYLQRFYAQAAMQAHLEQPEAFKEAIPPIDYDAVLRERLMSLHPAYVLIGCVLVILCVVLSVGATNAPLGMRLFRMLGLRHPMESDSTVDEDTFVSKPMPDPPLMGEHGGEL